MSLSARYPNNHADSDRLELVSSSIDVPDIDQAAEQLQRLFSTESRELESPQLRLIAENRLLGYSSAEDYPLISSLYDDILDNWIGSLPITVPVQIREVKERLARRVATEVILSSIHLRMGEPSHNTRDGLSGDNRTTLPILPSRKPAGISSQPAPVVSHFFQDVEQRSASQPTPSVPFDSQPMISQTEHPNPVTRLSQHVKIMQTAPTIPSSINRILGHWIPGVDPSTYDWEGMTQFLAEDDEADIGDEDARKKEQAKLRRHAERQRKRQRREEELEQKNAETQSIYTREVVGMRSSPIPFVGLGMSSETQRVGGQSQSQVLGVVQSQVEPGRHGGRPAVNKKKAKNRISGF